jgi:hypothetical protein
MMRTNGRSAGLTPDPDDVLACAWWAAERMPRLRHRRLCLAERTPRRSPRLPVTGIAQGDRMLATEPPPLICSASRGWSGAYGRDVRVCSTPDHSRHA